MPPLVTGSSNRSATGLTTTGWFAVWIAFATILPWTVVAVFDAIDSRYRRIRTVIVRLILSTTCNAIAYAIGLWFVAELVFTVDMKNRENGCLEDKAKCSFDRFDEVATFLVLLFFNVWFVFRNVRGWLQLFSLWRLRPLFHFLQRKFAEASSHPPEKDEFVRSSQSLKTKRSGGSNYGEDNEFPDLDYQNDGIRLMRISDRLINNDLETQTPFLNPFVLHGKAWSIAAWRAWWTQDYSNHVPFEPTNYDPDPICTKAQDLPRQGPRWPLNAEIDVVNPIDGSAIRRGDKEAWENALRKYGSPQGQQDSRGPAQDHLFNSSDRTGIATLIHEITHCIPHRMSSLWYVTARFEDVYEAAAREINAKDKNILLPSHFADWKELAIDIAANLEEPVYLSGDGLSNYAGRIASASLLLTQYSYEYRGLVERIYHDGRFSRWTFGWSGLLSCYSNLWTRHRVFMAMLNGLSLLAIRSSRTVAEIEPSVRALMVGYCSFAISDRAIGKKIANFRKQELLDRYVSNRSRSARGLGLATTREACRILGIPSEASHLDGLPSFATGWSMKHLLFKAGVFTPEHGNYHGEIEEREGSSNAWRYPYSKV